MIISCCSTLLIAQTFLTLEISCYVYTCHLYHQRHQKVYPKVPLNLKNIFVGAKVHPVRKIEGKKMRFEICEHIVSTDNFKSSLTQITHFIRLKNLGCLSNEMLYWSTCETSVNKMQIVHKIFYQGSATIDVPIETFQKMKKLSNNHLTLIFQGKHDGERRSIYRDDNNEKWKKQNLFLSTS